MMQVPVLCVYCKQIAHMRRLPFAWATLCNVCHMADIQYDAIILGQENNS